MSTRIRQILFVPPAPVVWANHLQSFARFGLEVETTQTLSSDQLGQGLADGTWDVGIAVMDNVIAWNSERGAGLRIIAQLERSTVMSFCCVAQYRSLAEAAARVIAVDSTTNGFVLVLYRALARAGIDWRRILAEGRFEPVGGVKHRFDALAAGHAAATILVPPFDELAAAKGFQVLWRGQDIAPAYPGVVACARGKWLAENGDAALRYLCALAAANAWATRPENAEPAQSALAAARYTGSTAQRLARETVPDLAPSRAGWEEVVALRRECGLLPQPAPSAGDTIDTVILEQAIRRVRAA